MPEAPAPAGTLLGFDYGRRRIGVAVGQTLTGTATALVTIAHAAEPDWQALDRLVREWRPAALVLGLPLDGEGNETEMSREARAFGAVMAERYGLPVRYQDERLSSVAAGEQFVQARSEGRARRRDAKSLDARAAQIILENWLQSQPGA
ncbi:MAG: Holliday junction resolvase RuvX [Xanthomonadales bacterium]|nr:Holliday junction resolvase RuvX [Xanthomonadales bacterium]